VTSAAVVGSGPNGLAAARTLATAGVSVRVYEAAERLGGGSRSSELTLPGLIHDECSAAHPLALDTAFSRAAGLEAHGLEWCWPEVQYSHPLDGGRGAAAYRSVTDTIAGLGAGGGGWRWLFESLADGFDALAPDLMQPVLHVPRHPLRLTSFGLKALLPATVAARRLGDSADADEARALFAGVTAHAFRPLTSPMSAAVGLVLGGAAHSNGWPVARGGSQAIIDAMASACRAHGAQVETGTTIESLAELGSPDLVMLDVAPGAAVRLSGERMPPRIRRALTRFRHGPAAFKVDFAVAGGVPWTHEPTRRAGTVHVGGSFEEIAAGEAAISRGQMPERPFVLVCQQYLADPSRAAGDLVPLYAYAHVPAGHPGDATAAIEAQIERFAPGFRERIQARAVRTVAEAEAYDANFVGGDIATGSTDMLQTLFRPRPALNPYSLGIPGVYLCSAATPPGAGAHGMCGYNAARSALRHLSR
jgi:phytoene dehydrogenase-like protein